MQASHQDVHQEGSHFGPVEASQSNIFQGNFSGLIINATVAAQVTPSRYEGHYSHSSLQPVPNYVQRPALHEKLRKQIHHIQMGWAEEPRIGVVWGLGGAGKSMQLQTSQFPECVPNGIQTIKDETLSNAREESRSDKNAIGNGQDISWWGITSAGPLTRVAVCSKKWLQ